MKVQAINFLEDYETHDLLFDITRYACLPLCLPSHNWCIHFQDTVRTKIAVYSKLPTHLTYFTSRCVLRSCCTIPKLSTLILFKDFVVTFFPSLRIPRCHVGMDDLLILYHLRVILESDINTYQSFILLFMSAMCATTNCLFLAI